MPMRLLTLSSVFSVVLVQPIYGISADDATRTDVRKPKDYTAESSADSAGDGRKVANKKQAILPALKGVVISKSAKSALDLQAKNPSGLVIDGFDERTQSAISRIVPGFLGKPVSLESLESLRKKIESAAQPSGGEMLKAIFPPQEITSGILAVRLAPARYGKVMMTESSFGKQFVAMGMRAPKGAPLDKSRIIEDLEWINENPLRNASISMVEGEVDDLVDIMLRVRSPKPWKLYAVVDNQLSDSLGDERAYLLYQYGDLWKLDHRFTGQYTTAVDVERLQAVSFVYETPLKIRQITEISSGYSESEAESDGPLDQSGKFSRVGVTHRIPLGHWHSVLHECRFGAEFRNNDYLFSDGSDSAVQFFQIEAGWKGRQNDRYGVTRMDFSLNYSPGNGALGSDDEDFIELGGSGAEAFIAKTELRRTLKLGKKWNLSGRLQAQWTEDDLLASDQIHAGGYNLVRGFDESVGYGSKGLVGGIELQTRPYRLFDMGKILALSFIDGASLSRDQESDAGQLLSGGIGFRWQFEDSASARFDVALPLDHPKSEDGDAMIHFGVTKSW